MSRLHVFAASLADISTQFGVEGTRATELLGETTEGLPGLGVIEHKGRRLLKGIDWGFPRLTREMRERGDPPGRIGLVADLTNPLWEELVQDARYRCLIPITHFANPDGVAGSKSIDASTHNRRAYSGCELPLQLDHRQPDQNTIWSMLMEQREPDPLHSAIGGALGVIAAFIERANIATVDDLARALAIYGSVTNETDAEEAAIIAQWVLALEDVADRRRQTKSPLRQ